MKVCFNTIISNVREGSHLNFVIVCQGLEIGIWPMYITWQPFPSSTELIISVLEKLFLSYRYQSFIRTRVQGFLLTMQLNLSKVHVRSLI